MTLNGAQLLSACTKADPEWIGFCNGYMQAAFDATGGKGLEGRHDEATVSGMHHGPDTRHVTQASQRTRTSDGRDERRWKEWQEAQQGIRPGSSLESLPPGSFKYTVNLVEVDGVHVPKPGPIGPDGYYTEQANAEIADRKTRQTQPTIISGPRSWR